ncbi:MAG: ribonuclease P protein component [Sulfurifustaceae bacterium]
MPRARRLSGAADFDAARRGDLRSRDPFFNVTASRHPGSGRIGIAVSRRVSPKAVARNRIKRLIRESFRTQQGMLQGLNIVVVAQPPAARANNAALTRSLRSHWRQLLLQCNDS